MPKAQIFKEFCITTNGVTWIVVRPNNYSHRLSDITALVAEARRDFPGWLQSEDDIHIIMYGGSHYKGTMGIEFEVPAGTAIPDSYRQIQELELRL